MGIQTTTPPHPEVRAKGEPRRTHNLDAMRHRANLAGPSRLASLAPQDEVDNQHLSRRGALTATPPHPEERAKGEPRRTHNLTAIRHGANLAGPSRLASLAPQDEAERQYQSLRGALTATPPHPEVRAKGEPRRTHNLTAMHLTARQRHSAMGRGTTDVHC